MVYCMSDIHGEIDRYRKMLDLIQFSDEDELYIIGDVIDRHPGGIDLLVDEIIDKSNIYMILGNHEEMLIHALGSNNKFWYKELWKQNGGSGTYNEMVYHRTQEERQTIIDFLKELPDYIDLEVNGQKFHLVHGMPSDDHEKRLWNRPERSMTEAPMDGVTVIVGHTATVFLNEESDNDEDEPFRIWYGNGIICIDCGCGSRVEERRLACLRLDDMKEFYV